MPFSNKSVFSNKSERTIHVTTWKKEITEDYTQYIGIFDKALKQAKENKKFCLG